MTLRSTPRSRLATLAGAALAAAALVVTAGCQNQPAAGQHAVPQVTAPPTISSSATTVPSASTSSAPTSSAPSASSARPTASGSTARPSSQPPSASAPVSMDANLPRLPMSVLLGAKEMGGYPAVGDDGEPVPATSTTPSKITATTCGPAPYGPYLGLRERVFPNYGEGPTAHQVVLRFDSTETASAQFERIRAHLLACPRGKSQQVTTPSIGAAPNGIARWRAVAFHAVTTGSPYSDVDEILLVQANNRVEIAAWSGLEGPDRTLANAHFEGLLSSVGPLVARRLAS